MKGGWVNLGRWGKITWMTCGICGRRRRGWGSERVEREGECVRDEGEEGREGVGGGRERERERERERKRERERERERGRGREREGGGGGGRGGERERGRERDRDIERVRERESESHKKRHKTGGRKGHTQQQRLSPPPQECTLNHENQTNRRILSKIAPHPMTSAYIPVSNRVCYVGSKTLVSIKTPIQMKHSDRSYTGLRKGGSGMSVHMGSHGNRGGRSICEGICRFVWGSSPCRGPSV